MKNLPLVVSVTYLSVMCRRSAEARCPCQSLYSTEEPGIQDETGSCWTTALVTCVGLKREHFCASCYSQVLEYYKKEQVVGSVTVVVLKQRGGFVL